MKKYIFTLLFITACLVIQAQVSTNKYWVKFTDKDNSSYSINNPEEFLSQRALDRRVKHNIPIMENDIPVNDTYIQGVKDAGATVLNASRWYNSVTIYTTSSSVLDAINALPYVQGVNKASGGNDQTIDKFEKPFFAQESYSKLPESVSFKQGSDAQSYNYGQAFNQIDMLNGIPLHDMGYDGEGMIIAILDAGFLNVDNLEAFDELWNNGQILGSKDFVSPANPDIFGSHSHGAMVLSTMGAMLPGQIVGTAPKADYWLLRSEDGGTETLIEELNWVSAAEFADSVGADVINSSLGYTTFDNPIWDHSYEDMDGNTTPITIGADLAASKGMIVVNSAGNSGGSSWQYIGAPADGDSVFSIGAVNSSGSYAGFSSTGPTYDGRVKPNVVAQGQGSTIVEPWGGSVSSGNGTSFSSPITAGMVACLWQAAPDSRNTEIMEAIQQSGSQATDPDYELGYGIPDYHAALGIITDTGSKSINNNFSRILPNPVVDEAYLDLSGNVQFVKSIVITDITGKVVSDQKLNRYAGNDLIMIRGVKELKHGIYAVRVVFETKTEIHKVIRK